MITYLECQNIHKVLVTLNLHKRNKFDLLYVLPTLMQFDDSRMNLREASIHFLIVVVIFYYIITCLNIEGISRSRQYIVTPSDMF